MTFLELCKLTRQECGIQGQGPSSVESQSGIMKKVVEWVRDANTHIETLHADWDFLWSEYTSETIEGSDTLTRPADFGMWDVESFGVDRGTSDGRKLTLVDYKVWRQNYNLKTNNQPSRLTILPSGNLSLMSPADGIYEIYANYWQTSTELTTNTQVPLIPERFHRLIAIKAMMYFFQDQESTTQYQQSQLEYNKVLSLLEGYSLPGQQRRSQGQPDLSAMTIRPS